MAQLAGYRADTAAKADKVCIAGHDAFVREMRTAVNVESVRAAVQKACMSEHTSIGDQLRSLQKRSGLSYDAIARKAGYTGRSSVQRYFTSDYDPEYLPLSVAERLADAFEGTDVERGDVMALAGLPTSNVKTVQYEGASLAEMRRDVPVYGTALGAPEDFDGEAIEQTTLNTGEIIGYFPRPVVLNGRANVYGLYIQGGSMSPRFEHGESAFVEKGRPPRIGDEVVVYMRDLNVDDGKTATGVMVKRLVRNSADCIQLEQFNPPITFKVERARVLRVDRVIPWGELLS